MLSLSRRACCQFKYFNVYYQNIISLINVLQKMSESRTIVSLSLEMRADAMVSQKHTTYCKSRGLGYGLRLEVVYQLACSLWEIISLIFPFRSPMEIEIPKSWDLISPV